MASNCLMGRRCAPLTKGSGSPELDEDLSKTGTDNCVSPRSTQSEGLVLRKCSLHGATTGGDCAVLGTEENGDLGVEDLN